MSSANVTELADILTRVTTWPTTLRITLARKILESVDKAEALPESPPPPEMRDATVSEVRRDRKTKRPAGDDETARLLERSETHPPAPPPRKGSLKDLLGILKTDAPSPNVAECRSILEEELTKKHLK